MVTRGFTGRRPTAAFANRLPPGQFETDDFPVLSKGPAPRIDMAAWRFTLSDGPRPLKRWTWDEFMALPRTVWQGDIHCVTTWSKFDTRWEGVTIDDLLTDAGIAAPTPWLLALSLDDYDTNVPAADLLGGRAMVATHFDGQPLAPEHGGPARLLVPHLYFWKSAKWIKGLKFTARDEAGFWELRGYHIYGDPWRQQRYSDDP
ncbi:MULTISPECIES: sulfite oxidase-like oxidoreductase [unclassified Variovorax]|jgi:DMSO/TMAO reductase YedYZ molybdopterin-dependent catalytic subunit|uniref:sulfite oxidase-like oxidoreductase n=1 Tax=unclassified Variovorax TaxID=663243 RepID=UPI002B230506|nr:MULTISPECIES: sulfite oxidase-like oxidoreductase [unclassified Variovorax]MEB0056023.1 sulfite oxidase-like oxidoreductase [Variovorax sp. LG9.2]MEB0111160.1 sulfite oxidase-like oxidoreductase [Variovorax sp. RTB1]